VSECGLVDRVKAEMPEKKVVGACVMCPYMKSIMLKDVLTALKKPRVDQMVILDEGTLKNARRSLDKMFELAELNRD
jgi:quinolinate synthase